MAEEFHYRLGGLGFLPVKRRHEVDDDAGVFTPVTDAILHLSLGILGSIELDAVVAELEHCRAWYHPLRAEAACLFLRKGENTALYALPRLPHPSPGLLAQHDVLAV